MLKTLFRSAFLADKNASVDGSAWTNQKLLDSNESESFGHFSRARIRIMIRESFERIQIMIRIKVKKIKTNWIRHDSKDAKTRRKQQNTAVAATHFRFLVIYYTWTFGACSRAGL
jgi:hypothetical protein